MFSSQIKKFVKPTSIVKAILNGLVKTEAVYMMSKEDSEIIAVVDGTPDFGPTTGQGYLRVTISPHPWAQEVADLLWESRLDADEPTDFSKDTSKPGKKISKTGWVCRIRFENVNS